MFLSAPTHFFPVVDGTGLSHFRYLSCFPQPQLPEHLEYSLQRPQLPSLRCLSAVKKYIVKTQWTLKTDFCNKFNLTNLR